MRETCKHCGSTEWHSTHNERWVYSHDHNGNRIYTVYREVKCEECSKLFELNSTEVDYRSKFVDIQAIRTAVADYMHSEGCSCCQGDDHDMHTEVLAKLLGVELYSDGSGYCFSPYKTGAKVKKGV